MCRSQNIFMKTVRSTFRSVSSLSRTSTSSSLSRSHCLRTTSDAFCAPYSTNLVKSNEGIEYSLMKEWVKEEDLHFAFEGFPKAKYSEMHTVLHPSSDDPTLLCLAEANSMEDVFKIISTREGQLNGNLASQAIVTLWDLQKFYCRWKRPDCSQSDYFKSLREFISVSSIIIFSIIIFMQTFHSFNARLLHLILTLECLSTCWMNQLPCSPMKP